MQYLLYRNGLLPSDTQKLLAHARLPSQDGEVIHNLDLLGAHVSRSLKDTRPLAQPLFGRKQAPQNPNEEESGLSRFSPALKPMLEEHVRGTLDQGLFPFTKPHLDASEGLMGSESISQASLRSAKPTWARTRPSALEPRQRIIVFMAGGATYSESRACYEVSQASNKDVLLATSHMLTPSLYLRQVGDLSVDKRRLDLPAERPKPRAPAHLFDNEPSRPPEPNGKQSQAIYPSQQLPTTAMRTLNIAPNHGSSTSAPNGVTKNRLGPSASSATEEPPGRSNRKDEGRDPGKKKKKHHFFSSKK